MRAKVVYMQVAASSGFFFHLRKGPWKVTKLCYNKKIKKI